MSREDELIQQGWEKQNTYDEPRLSEIVELYEEMDLEVLVEPFDPSNELGCTACTECMKISQNKYKTIYTRKKSQKKCSKGGNV